MQEVIFLCDIPDSKCAPVSKSNSSISTAVSTISNPASSKSSEEETSLKVTMNATATKSLNAIKSPSKSPLSNNVDSSCTCGVSALPPPTPIISNVDSTSVCESSKNSLLTPVSSNVVSNISSTPSKVPSLTPFSEKLCCVPPAGPSNLVPCTRSSKSTVVSNDLASTSSNTSSKVASISSNTSFTKSCTTGTSSSSSKRKIKLVVKLSSSSIKDGSTADSNTNICSSTKSTNVEGVASTCKDGCLSNNDEDNVVLPSPKKARNAGYSMNESKMPVSSTSIGLERNVKNSSDVGNIVSNGGLNPQNSLEDLTMLDDTSDFISDSDFVGATFEEMQSSDIEQVKGYLLNPDYGEMSKKKRDGWKMKKAQYLLNTNVVSSNMMKCKIRLLSAEKENGKRKVLEGIVHDVVYYSDGQPMWVLNFNQSGIWHHHRYCSVQTMENIVKGMESQALAVSATKIKTKAYEEVYRGQKDVEPVELIIETSMQNQSNSLDDVNIDDESDGNTTKDRSKTTKGTFDGYCFSVPKNVTKHEPHTPYHVIPVVSPSRKVVPSSISDISVQTGYVQCRICKDVIATKKTEEVANKIRSNPQFEYLQEKQKQRLCIICSVDMYQYERKNDANKMLLRLIHAKTRKYSWKNSGEIRVLNFLEEEEMNLTELAIVYREAQCLFPDVFPSVIKMQTIDRRDRKGVLRQKSFLSKRKQFIKSLNGAEFNTPSQYVDILDRSIGVTDLDDGHVGIILLPGNNYITMMNGKFPASDVVNQAIKDTEDMMSSVNMSKRAGSATGFVTSSTISSSLPNCTDATLLPPSKGVSANVTWKSSKDGKQKVFRGVYADGFLNHQTSKSKKKELERSTYMKHLLVSRGMSRLITAIMLEHFEIDSSNTAKGLLEWIDIDLKKKINKSRKDSSFMRLCDSLRRYMCTFGRTNNFQALAAHKDGNSVSKMESLMINGRVTREDVESARQILQTKHLTDECYEHVRSNMTDGYLFLPLDGIVLRMRGGADIMNCNLDNTIHVADLSRNAANFSMVEGGCDND